MCVTVTKLEDHVTQRHEQIGTAKIYQALGTKDVTVRVHTHDRNMAINKFVRNQPLTVNQNDTWHGVKSVKKAMSEVASGPRYLEGKKWSEELHDKVESVATRFHWAIRNCNGDSAKLRLMLDNVVDHYKNIHDKCSESSRCRADPYEPKRVVIGDPKAELLLRGVIRNSTVYKSPDDFNLARDTFFVESFNNTLNVYEDKRISFGLEQYKMRSYLATCHWNENVGRAHASVSNVRNPRAPRRNKGRKVLKRPTFTFRANIWKKYIKRVHSKR